MDSVETIPVTLDALKNFVAGSYLHGFSLNYRKILSKSSTLMTVAIKFLVTEFQKFLA